MRGWTRSWRWLPALAVALPGPALGAQEPPDSAGSEALRSLRPGAAVRFTHAGARGSGVVEDVGAGSLLLRPDGADAPIRLEPARLDSLWIRTNAAGAGAAVGTLLGVVPVVATCGREVDECGLVPNGLVVVGVAAALGYLVGREIEGWRRLLP